MDELDIFIIAVLYNRFQGYEHSQMIRQGNFYKLSELFHLDKRAIFLQLLAGSKIAENN